ncbi:MAG TPA: SAM domain-containing protein [Verrucomicrobiae bacterium]|nr:SAM domain-containing protein [Verrucomicrobiae bacterium]
MEIADWLRGLSLDRYAETFRDNAIDVAVLPELSESDLEKLGVLLGHRKIMLTAIAALRGGAAENIAEPGVTPKGSCWGHTESTPKGSTIPPDLQTRNQKLETRNFAPRFVFLLDSLINPKVTVSEFGLFPIPDNRPRR